MMKNLSVDDIPRLIGKGGMGMKTNVIRPSWAMYEEHIKSKSIEEEKPKLFIGLEETDGVVIATIKTESDIMKKFAEYNFKKYVDKLISQNEKKKEFNVYTIYAPCPHIRVPQLIGKAGKTIMHLRNITTDNLNFDDESLRNAKKSFIKVNPYKYESITEFNQMVRQNGNKSFIGWEPDEEDDDEYVSIVISNKLSEKEMEEFVDEFKSVLGDKLSDIKDRHSRVMNDIDEALSA
jgi:predicted PilT family ATPase